MIVPWIGWKRASHPAAWSKHIELLVVPRNPVILFPAAEVCNIDVVYWSWFGYVSVSMGCVLQPPKPVTWRRARRVVVVRGPIPFVFPPAGTGRYHLWIGARPTHASFSVVA